jgi:hypothetical protein
MTADELYNQLDQNRRMMARCPLGCVPTLEYEAGCTFGGCEHHRLAMPDWQPVELRKEWNEKPLKQTRR